MKRIQIMRSIVPLAIAAGCIFGSRHAFSAPPPTAATTASALFTSGEARYKAGDYAAALADFTAADGQKPSPDAARAIGLCEDKLGHYRAAATAYDRFLARPGATLVDDVGPTVARVREIEQMPGIVRIDVEPPGASLAIDGASERKAAPRDAYLSPGRHLIRASAPGYEALEREVSVTFASTQAVALTPTPAPPPPMDPAPVTASISSPRAPVPRAVVVPSEPHPAPVTRRTVAVAAAGIAILGAGLATTFGVLALNNKRDWERHPTLSNSDKGNDDAAYADGAIALTIAAGVTSLVLFLTDDPTASTSEPAHTAAFSASPFLTPHGGGGGALVHF